MRIREWPGRQVPQAEWQFKETLLRDVVATLQETVQIPLDIDIPAFGDLGIDVDPLISFNPRVEPFAQPCDGSLKILT